MTRHEAHIDKAWEELGLASLVVSRIRSDGTTDFAHLLVDVFCLGVKDALAESDVTVAQYRDYLAQSLPEANRESLHPACARKLAEGAVAFAESLGFSPHRDYRKARRVFSGVDAAACPRDFTYGLDGRPHYIPGPDDTEERIDRVLTMLEAKFGPDGFGFEEVDDEDDEEDVALVRDELTDWLAKEPMIVPRFYTFSGIVTGMLLCPTSLAPLKVMDLLWGPEGRLWQDAEEMQIFMDRHMTYWNHVNNLILDCVHPEAPFDTPCMDVWEEDFAEDEGPQLVMALRDWCAGFVRSVELWSPADAAQLDSPTLAPHWEVVRVFARFESQPHAQRIEAMTQETPPRRLGSSVTALARGLRQPVV